MQFNTRLKVRASHAVQERSEAYIVIVKAKEWWLEESLGAGFMQGTIQG